MAVLLGLGVYFVMTLLQEDSRITERDITRWKTFWGMPAGEMPPLNDFERLDWLIDKYKKTEVDVVSDGRTLEPSMAWTLAKLQLRQTFKEGMAPADWIRQHAYQTRFGNVIYFKFPNGDYRLMRDVFLEEIEKMKAGDVPEIRSDSF